MNKLEWRFVAALALALAAVGISVGDVRAQSLKIGVFDPQRVSEATVMGKAMQGQLESFQAEKQAAIDASRKEIAALQKQLSEQRLSLSADTRNRMEMDIQRRLLALEGAQDLATREMQLELAAAKGMFEEKLLIAVEQFGKDEGFSIVLDRTLVAWASNAVDVTSALIDRFDLMFPSSEGAP